MDKTIGYKKSEDDKHVLAPDPVTAPVVQLIFCKSLNILYYYKYNKKNLK